jgi:hypothetical protein
MEEQSHRETSIPPNSYASSLTTVTEPQKPATVTEKPYTEPQYLEKATTHTSIKDGSPSLRPVQTREDGEEYPTGLKLASIILAICLCVFLVALGMYPAIVIVIRRGNSELTLRLCCCMYSDNSIIATAIPKITDEFNSLSDVAWYGSGTSFTTPCLDQCIHVGIAFAGD